MTLVAEGPPKLCRECGFKRPRSDFYARRSPNGNLYAYHLCKTHEKERVMAAQRANRERTRANDRAVRERKMQDPERAAFHRDYQREWYRRTHNLSPEQHRPTHFKHRSVVGKAKRMPVEPFAQWLETLGDSSTEIATITGLSDRQVRTYLARERNVLVDVADRAVLHAATATTLDDIWTYEGD